MKSLIIIVLAIGVTLTTTVSGGCQTPNYQRNGTILGGLGGAGLGAAIGNKSQNALAGGLIGGAIGAIAGNAVGEGIDNDRAVATQQAAQQGYAQGAGAQAVKGAVTPQDVVAMSRAGLSEDVIASHVRANGVTQQLQVNDLIYLRNQGVSDSVLQAMQQAPTSQARYNAAYSAAIPPPPVARPVVVEHVYPAYYPPPPPYYWGGPYYHNHYHRGPPPGSVHWGISVGR
ncbi:glycine zipper domain-containing protein [Anatilimnocola floriformis]|uniref:glycine zipper domain-containing protein n=1 Tax=Anatilimnocola floriformis TaxID=2948575 RepID=UPI0020C2FA25|nr:glycine zipper domain-containing protein [Anatilimnocola floriformis]